MNQATVNALPVLTADGVRLREVQVSDAAALTALFQIPEVSAYLDPPPASVEDFAAWIELSQSRRAEGRAACYTLFTGDLEVAGLFMALRLDDMTRAEIGFALNPKFWGTGLFMKSMDLYLDFLFAEWGVKVLVGKTLEDNGRGVGAMGKLGARVLELSDRNGAPEFTWTIERG